VPMPLRVDAEDIQRLDAQQLTTILRILLHLEARLHEIPLSGVRVQAQICVGDGGEDGRIQWQGDPERTDFLPRRFTFFQCKATHMAPAQCKDEITTKSGELKLPVKELLEQEGTYVLFYARGCNTLRREPLVGAFREAVERMAPERYNPDFMVYDSGQIASWVNCFPSAVLDVHQMLGRRALASWQTWRGWQGYPRMRFEYVGDKDLYGYIDQLRSHFSQSPRQVARIIGPSGLGKTRLALEAFRPPPHPSASAFQQSLSDSVAYLDANRAPSSQVADDVANWRSQRASALLVVDNCPLELHKTLCQEVEHCESQLNLLTLDYDVRRDQRHPLIELAPTSNEVIKKILEQAYPSLPRSDLERIAGFAQGFPQMAALLAEARLADAKSIASLNDDDLVDRLLWGRTPRPIDPVAGNVISGCALFEQLGFKADMAAEREFVAEHICKVDKNEFYKHALAFESRGILVRHGRFVRVTPIPLAVRLAADWWRGCSPELARSLLETMPSSLVKAMCDRMALLDFLPEARNLVGELCGERGPFGRAEVLDSEVGSRLFLSLTEVNPRAAAQALNRVFGGRLREELLQVGPGRRNIVWALEKICFLEETFSAGAQLMLAFAAAENETWGNNATAQFLQLFRVYLAGTEAPPSLRLALLEHALHSPVPEERRLAVEALGQALRIYPFTRSAGPEHQGSGPTRQDWVPTSASEALDYRRSALERLTELACTATDLSDLACQQIAENIFGLVRCEQVSELRESLLKIVRRRGPYWPDALAGLRSALSLLGSKLPPDTVAHLETLVKALQPKSLSERLRLIVSTPPWECEKTPSGRTRDVAALRAKGLARECAHSPDLLGCLPELMQGEQRQGYVFGHRLGECWDEPETFIDAACAALAALPHEQANPVILKGFLDGIRPAHEDTVAQTLDKLADDDKTCPYVVGLSCRIHPPERDLQRALALVQAQRVPVSSLRSFAYGNVLQGFPVSTVISFCNAMLAHGPEGAVAALDVLLAYSDNDPLTWDSCGAQVRKTLLAEGVLACAAATGMDSWRWKEAAEKLLQEGEDDQLLATRLCKEIVDACAAEDLYLRIDHCLKPVLRILLRRYSHAVWPALTETLLAKASRTKLHLEGLLGPDEAREETPVLMELPSSVLMSWCDDMPERATTLVHILAPLLQDDETSLWQPFVLSLIDRFGRDRRFLSVVGAGVGSGGFWGSAVPFYERQIRALQQLLDHEYSEVRAWASSRIGVLKQDVEHERICDAEEEAGIL